MSKCWGHVLHIFFLGGGGVDPPSQKKCKKLFSRLNMAILLPWTKMHVIVSLDKSPPWTKVSLDNCLLGLMSPRTNVSLDKCPLDKCLLGHMSPWTHGPWTNVSTPRSKTSL